MRRAWILLPLLLAAGLLPGVAQAAYEVYTYGNNDTYQGVFNAVASIFSNGNYKTIIKIVMMIGIMAGLLVTAIFKLSSFLTWFIQALMLYFLLNIPIATVIVHDRVNNDPPQTIDNVPVILAAAAEFTTKMGDWSTRAFETVFSVPDEMRVSTRGMRFGHKAINYASMAYVREPELMNDLTFFFRNCVLPEISRGAINVKDILNSSASPWETMWNNTNPARITTIMTMSSPKTVGCSDAALGGQTAMLDFVSLDESLKKRVDDSVAVNAEQIGMLLFPTKSAAAAAAGFSSDLGVVNTALLKSSMTATETLDRFMFVNFWKNSGGNIPAIMNDPAGVQLTVAQTQAEQQMLNSYRVEGALARDTMPMYRNVIEMLIISLFPVMVVVAIASGATSMLVIRGYLMGLVWVALWPPLYAVVNYFGIIHDSRELAALLIPTGNYIAYASAGDVIKHLAYSDAMASKLIMLIPFIAAAIVKGFDMVGVTMMSQLMGTAQQAAARAGAEMTTGNHSMGQVSTPDVKRTADGGYQRLDVGGGTREFDSSGKLANVSGQGFDVKGSESLSRDLSLQASHRKEAAMEQARLYGQSLTAALDQAIALEKNHRVSDAMRTSHSDAKSAEEAAAFHRVIEAANSVAKKLNISKEEAVSFGVGSPIKVVKAELVSKGMTSEEAEEAATALSKENVDKAMSHARRVATTAEGVHDDATARSASAKIGASLNQAVESRESASARFMEGDRYEKAAKQVEQAGINYDRDFNTRVMDRLATISGSHEMAAYTSRQAKLGSTQSQRLIDDAVNFVKAEEMSRLVNSGFHAPKDNISSIHERNIQAVSGRGEVLAAHGQFAGVVSQKQNVAGVNPDADNRGKVATFGNQVYGDMQTTASAVDANGQGVTGRKDELTNDAQQKIRSAFVNRGEWAGERIKTGVMTGAAIVGDGIGGAGYMAMNGASRASNTAGGAFVAGAHAIKGDFDGARSTFNSSFLQPLPGTPPFKASGLAYDPYANNEPAPVRNAPTTNQNAGSDQPKTLADRIPK